MKKYCYFLVTLLILATSSIYGQNGKIITVDKADQEFGAPQFTVTIAKGLMQELAGKAGDNIMMKVRGNKLIMLDNDRNLIYPSNIEIADDEEFTVYSVSVLNDLLGKASDANVTVEQRPEVISVTYGNFTMEYGAVCPPVCP